jgi:autotransporter-associated beta strand protein
MNRAITLNAGGGTLSASSTTILTENGNIGGSGGLTSTGAGTVTLTAADTYTGATNINQGTLALSGAGSIANSSHVEVAAGAALDASAITAASTIGGSVHNQGNVFGGTGANVLDFTGAVGGSGAFHNNVEFSGSYGPGNSPALVSMDNATFDTSNILTMELGGLTRGSQYDGIDAITLALGGTLQINLIDLGSGSFVPSLGNTFDLFTANAITGMFSTFDFSDAVLGSGLHWAWDLLDSLGGGQVFQLYVAADASGDGVPTPATWLLLMAGLVIMIVGRAAMRAGSGRANG